MVIPLSKKTLEAINSLDISREDGDDTGGPLLADQMEASPAGGSIDSDAKEDSPESKEQSNDLGMGMDTPDMGSTDMGGDMTGDTGGMDGDPSQNSMGGNTGSTNNISNEDPSVNPFKGDNGKDLMETKLAELQSNVSGILDQVQTNPNTDFVVVSELEDLLDSIKKLRETVYIVPIEKTEYKYKLAVTSYALLSKDICEYLLKKKDSFCGESDISK